MVKLRRLRPLQMTATTTFQRIWYVIAGVLYHVYFDLEATKSAVLQYSNLWKSLADP